MIDAAVAEATRIAARTLRGHLEELGPLAVGERTHQKPAFRQALADAGVHDVHASEKTYKLESWTPPGAKGRLGGFDIVVGDPAAPTALFELKWVYRYYHELGWTLWDIYKLAAAHIELGATGYAVVGAPTIYRDESAVACSDLFCNGTWSAADLFARYRIAWMELLMGGSARPARLPASIRTTLIASVDIDVDPGWQLRTIRIDAEGDAWLDFANGWPVST